MTGVDICWNRSLALCAPETVVRRPHPPLHPTYSSKIRKLK